MKKILFFGALVAMLLGIAACSSDIEPNVGDDVVRFTIEMPGNIDSRAIADGNTANKLTVAVYDQDGVELPNIRVNKDIPHQTTVEFKLVKGQTYSFAFWAQAAGAPYTFDTANKTVTVSYEGAKSNDETRDAFYAYRADLVVTGPMNETVYLYRPFCQLNYGASDYNDAIAAGVDVTESAVTVDHAATAFNLATGATTGDVEVTFTQEVLPDDPEILVVNETNYQWMAMNYFLVPNNEATIETSLQLYEDGATDPVREITVPNVPVQKNHRTNIVGNLFTEDVGFNVIIDERFDQPDYNFYYPATAICGKFSISASMQIEFAAGNVQYHTGTHAWRFAENQYDVVGVDDNIRLGDPTLSAWVDLFAWSCESVPYGVSPSNKDADYTGAFMDWGDLFAGNWRTLTKDEMQYILTGRANAANLRAEGTVAGQHGLILLPDEWTLPSGLTFVPGYVGYAGWNGVEDENADIPEYTENIYTAEQWRFMEGAGAVFLPHAGSRVGGYGNMWNGAAQATFTNPETGFYSWVDNVNDYGYYWTSTAHPTSSILAYYLITPGWEGHDTYDNYLPPVIWARELRRGNSVRLVRVLGPYGGGEGMIDEGEENE